MYGKRFITKAAVFVLAGLALTGARAAWAIDVPLPGERKVEVHGFYEFRVRGFFNDSPFDSEGISLSQFRHVLNIETDIEMFPEGVGPFDFVSGFTRWIISYECVYQRACGIFPSADNFGGDKRDAVREPANFSHATREDFDLAGLHKNPLVPGTLRDPHDRLTPGHRYRGCVNPDGVLVNPNPLAGFCNFNSRTPLGNPSLPIGFNNQVTVPGGQEGLFSLGRAGGINNQFDEFDYRAGRSYFAQFGLTDLSAFAAQASLTTGETSTANSFKAEADRAETRLPGGAAFCEDEPNDPRCIRIDTLRRNANALLRDTRQSFIRDVLETRPDPDRFTGPKGEATGRDAREGLARAQAPDLVTAIWGSQGGFKDVNVPWLATINTAIKPQGYLRSESQNTIDNMAFGLTQDPEDGQAQKMLLVGGTGADKAVRLVDGTLVFLSGPEGQFEKAATVPSYFGPDGIGDTADDLPITPLVELSQDVRLLGKSFAPTKNPLTGEIENPEGNLVALGRAGLDGVLGSADDRPSGDCPECASQIQVYRVLGTGFDPTSREDDEFCTRGSNFNVPSPLSPAGVNIPGSGINAVGECVLLASSREAQFVNAELLGPDDTGDNLLSRFEAYAGLADEDARAVDSDSRVVSEDYARPDSALEEPTDLTDLKGRSVTRGRGLPARPPNPAGGVFFKSAGYKNFRKDHDNVVSALDLDFTETELRWDHGAGQDENEFREGYIEGEFLDSQVYFRTGKLLMVWGKTELFRNQDRMNPLDIGIGTLARLEEARIGQWATTMTLSPEAWMNFGPELPLVGQAKDVRLEFAVIYDDYEPTDLGKCGEGLTFSVVCFLSVGSYVHGLTGLAIAGRVDPYENYSGLKRYDYGVRLEGRFDRFTFALTDFWGWDDGPYLDLVNQYGRQVDSVTGAPVRNFGPNECRVRKDSDGQAIGPDGESFGDGSVQFEPASQVEVTEETRVNIDNGFASEGNCLLWMPDPDDPDGARILRSGEDIAIAHSANQTLFHTVCTLTFSEDSGRCALDLTNDVDIGQQVTGVLSGVGNASTAAIGARGWQSLRFKNGVPVVQSAETVDADPNSIPDLKVQLDSALTITNPDGILPPLFLFADTQQAVAREVNSLIGAFSNLGATQKALLGCGEHFASACDAFDALLFAQNEHIGDELGLDPESSDKIFGGIDLMNADASVVMQEFAPLQALSPGAGVGSRGGIRKPNGENYQPTTKLYYEPGITTHSFATQDADADGTPDNAEFLRVFDFNDPGDLTDDSGANLTQGDLENLKVENIGGETVLTFNGIPVNTTGVRTPGTELSLATDFEVEAFKYERDREAEQRLNVPVLFKDPRGADGILGTEDDPLTRNDEGIPIGENCANLGSPFSYGLSPDPGCTVLEMVSANLQRLLITNEIKGPDEVFDPAETLIELANMLDADPSTDLFGDPISGADGIVFANWIEQEQTNTSGNLLGLYGFRSDNPGGPIDYGQPVFQIVDEARDQGTADEDIVFQLERYQKAANGLEATTLYDPGAAQSFADQCAGAAGGVCYRVLAPSPSDPIVGTLPAGYQMFEVVPAPGGPGTGDTSIQASQATGQSIAVVTPGGDFVRVPLSVPLQRVSPLDVGEVAALQDSPDNTGVTAALATVSYLDPDTLELRQNVLVTENRPTLAGFFCPPGTTFCYGPNETVSLFTLDADGNKVPDLDDNRDGQLDLLDDGTLGPDSDDNPLCGSGVPGDVLQEAQQYELSRAETDLLEQGFLGSNGLPPRSPAFCSSVAGLLAATGQTLQVLKAGGTGRYGRRDFLWHGGRQVALMPQKTNVFGMSVDFAEGRTKTSWSLELSWTADKLFGNANAYDMTNESDEFVLTVSVDRPTFFNFLNPNRSFFINFQFFLRYLTDYVGGRDDKDGMFGVAEGPWDGLATLTMFSGYFQDRLQPRMTFVYSPTTSTGAALTGLSYRWNDAFSTSMAFNHFFGHPTQTQDAYFPLFLRGRSDTTSEAITRGLSAVRNRDVAILTMRMTF